MWKRASGASVTELGLVLGLIAVAIIGVLSQMGEQTGCMYQKASAALGGENIAKACVALEDLEQPPLDPENYDPELPDEYYEAPEEDAVCNFSETAMTPLGSYPRGWNWTHQGSNIVIIDRFEYEFDVYSKDCEYQNTWKINGLTELPAYGLFTSLYVEGSSYWSGTYFGNSCIKFSEGSGAVDEYVMPIDARGVIACFALGDKVLGYGYDNKVAYLWDKASKAPLRTLPFPPGVRVIGAYPIALDTVLIYYENSGYFVVKYMDDFTSYEIQESGSFAEYRNYYNRSKDQFYYLSDQGNGTFKVEASPR